MKKKLLRAALAIIAAGIISAAALPVFPASAAYIRDNDSIQKRYPETWTDPDTGAVYYSNWSNKEGRYKALFSTEQAEPYSKLEIVISPPALTNDELQAVCSTYFDERYQIYCYYANGDSGVQYAVITDKTARAETEQKCDQLYEALKQYELQGFNYFMNYQYYTEYTMIDSWLCTYHYATAAAADWNSTKDPQTGEKLTALITEKYPDWEVHSYIGDTSQGYSVRKKGCEFFDVPAPEYLDVAYTIKKELGYQGTIARIPEPRIQPVSVKFYLHPMGDADLNGDVDVTDAQSVLNIYADTLAGNTPQLQTEQTKAADVNTDGKIDSTDAQLILLYYVQNTLADKPTTWEELLSGK